MGGAVASRSPRATGPDRLAHADRADRFRAEINAGYLRGFADAQTRASSSRGRPALRRRELVTRQLVDDLLAYKRLDGVDEAPHAPGTLLDATLSAVMAAALAAVLDTGGDAIPVNRGLGRAGPDHPGGAGRVGGRAPAACRRRRAYAADGASGEVKAAIEETIARAG